MKRVLLLLFTLLFTLLFISAAFAQSNMNTDSLSAALVRHTQEDVAKLHLYYTLSEWLAWQNPVRGAQFAEQGYALARKINQRLWAARMLCVKASNKTGTGDFAEAFTFLEEGSAAIEQQGSPADRAKLYLAFAVAYSQKGLTDSAIIYNTKANALFTSLQDLHGQADCSLVQGVCMIDKGQTAELLVNANKTLAQCTQIGYKMGMVRATMQIGNYFLLSNNYAKAEEYDKKGLSIVNALNAPARACKCYADLGFVYKLQGKMGDAMDCYQKSLQLAETLELKGMLANNYDRIGGIHRALEEYDLALSFYEKAQVLNIASGDRHRLANTYASMGTMYGLLKSFSKAIAFNKKALDIYSKIDNKFGVRTMYYNIAAVYLDSKDFPHAHYYFTKSLDLSKNIDNRIWEASCLHGLGDVYLNANDSLLLSLDIPLNQRYQKGLEMFEAAMKIAIEGDDREFIFDIKNSMSQVYQKMGDYATAYTYFKAYIAEKDSVSGDKVKEQIARKTMQYEYDKKELALNYEQELTTAALSKQTAIAMQQQQSLTLKDQLLRIKEQALLLANKQEELQHLAFLKEKAEKQETEQALLLVEKDKDLATVKVAALAKEKNLQATELALKVKEIAQKRVFIIALLFGLLALCLGAIAYALWQRQKTAKKEAAQQQFFTNTVLQQIEQERTRIANDLHDNVNHNLLMIRSLLHGDEYISGKLDTVMNDVRTISRNMHPVMFDKIGLPISLAQLLEQVEEGSDILITSEIAYTHPLAPDRELQLYRIVQEGISNIVKYAEAEAIKVTLTSTPTTVFLEIKDNGNGFDVQKALDDGKAFGLYSILERSKAIGGKARISSTKKGTIISVSTTN